MAEPINPQAVNDYWHTLCLLMLRHFNKTELIISAKEFLDIEPNSLALRIETLGDAAMKISIIPMAEATRLAQEQVAKDAETNRNMRKM